MNNPAKASEGPARTMNALAAMRSDRPARGLWAVRNLFTRRASVLNGPRFPFRAAALRRLACCAGLSVAWMALRAQPLDTANLPGVQTLLERVAERAKRETENDRVFKECYAYTRHMVTEYRSSKGELKKRRTKESRHEPAGAPTSAPDADEPVELEEADPPAADARADHGDFKGRAYDKRDFPVTEDLLRRFTFEVVGRQTRAGRPVLILDFKPASDDLPEHNLKDKFINKAAGRVWIDEAEAAIVQVDLHLTEKVSVVGGLFGAVYAFRYQTQRERTPEGLWFARTVDWHLEGRQLFLRKFIDYHEERTDVRRVATPAPLAAPLAGEAGAR
jgi:hypothetical protein